MNVHRFAHRFQPAAPSRLRGRAWPRPHLVAGTIVALRLPAASGRLPSVAEVIERERPTVPLHCLRPATLEGAARRFVTAFPGMALYAVKCNPRAEVLRALWDGGVRHFDAASIAEVALVRLLLPGASVAFMHPIKSRPAIAEAFHRYGVTDFAVDSVDEIDKVLEETGSREIGLMVRLALPRGGAVWDLSGKFGSAPAEAATLLRRARAVAARVGLTFHVGSQCLDPAAWEQALDLAGTVIAESGVIPDVIDVGGGFPVTYPGSVSPPLSAFTGAIADGFARLGLGRRTELWCEPGRALVADGESVVVQVLARKGLSLFINDGIYGSLSDAGPPGFRFPVRLIPADGGTPSAARVAFAVFGPTCDSMDRLKEPWLLPADVGEGDWIEVGTIGAYGGALKTAFNGFDKALLVQVRDAPLACATVAIPAERVA